MHKKIFFKPSCKIDRMKKIFFSGIVMLTCSTLFAQHSLEKLWETDSVTLRNPESALFDPISNSLYVSSMNSGAIVRYGLDGKLIQNNWVTGLTSCKGSAIFNGLLYVAETSSVAVIDIQKASVVKHIPFEGAQMLNDLAVDTKGIIYVTDTRGAKVYRMEDEKPTVYLENMPGANGLLTVGTDLYVLTSARVDKIDDKKQITKVAEGFESGLDGIVMIGPNEFIISNYQGILYYLNGDGTNYILLDTRSKHIMSNDIGYDPKTKILYAPSFSTNRIIAYKVK
jgi:hypothetical protein